MSSVRSAWMAAVWLAVTVSPVSAQGLSAPAKGALAGVVLGGTAGLLLAHDSCDGDPCGTGAYVIAGVGGAALFAGLGAVVASRVRGDRGGRGALSGAIVGSVLGALGGVGLVAAACDSDECGPAGYTSMGLAGAAVFGTFGSLFGGRDGGSGSEVNLLGVRADPLVGVSSRGIALGIRSSY